MKLKYTIAAIGLTLFVVTIALALPYVDGALTPDDEYAGGDVQTGVYSKCYSKYVKGEGLYICNDWYNPDENFDPGDGCDAYNIFTWTDTQPNPDMYWRLKCPGDGSTPTIQKRPNDGQSQWQDVSTSGWSTSAGFHPSVNNATEHPIWEVLIPACAISEDIQIGLIDPKSVDPDDCPPVDSWSPPGFGSAPTTTVPDMLGDDSC